MSRYHMSVSYIFVYSLVWLVSEFHLFFLCFFTYAFLLLFVSSISHSFLVFDFTSPFFFTFFCVFSLFHLSLSLDLYRIYLIVNPIVAILLITSPVDWSSQKNSPKNVTVKGNEFLYCRPRPKQTPYSTEVPHFCCHFDKQQQTMLNAHVPAASVYGFVK